MLFPQFHSEPPINCRAGARAPSRWFFKAASWAVNRPTTGTPLLLITYHHFTSLWSTGVTPRFIHQSLGCGRDRSSMARGCQQLWWGSLLEFHQSQNRESMRITGYAETDGLLLTTGLKKLAGNPCACGHYWPRLCKCVYTYVLYCIKSN